ncbi:MAG: CAP domain-containing protein, partial [Tabrizicola sp.]|nr:CAP domain-containing protein [Tabrizicola sp.]
RLSPSLDKAAQGHACDIAKRQSISHVSSDGSQLQNRLRRAGYAYRTAAENTGRGFATGKRAVEWWMNSPHHKHNMLIGQMRDVGVGIAMSAAPDSRLHWIIVMGKSK